MLILCTYFVLLQALTPEVIEHAQAGSAALKDGHAEAAIAEFQKVIELQPQSAPGYANLGEAYFQKADYVSANNALEQALTLDPNLLGAHQTLGISLLIQGDAEGALPHLEKTRTPELLGLAYLETGQLGSAVMALHAALDRQPKDPDLLYYFGRAAALASEHARASVPSFVLPDKTKAAGSDIVTLQQAMALKPNDPVVANQFAATANQAAKDAFDRLMEGDPNGARAHEARGDRAVANGNPENAIQEYSRAIRLQPYTAGIHLALGDVLGSMADWKSAANQYRAEASLRPLSVEAFFRLGLALVELGQGKEAVTALARADQLRPRNPDILLRLAKAAFLAGDVDRSETALTQSLELRPEGTAAAEAHFMLAAIYRNSGRTREAGEQSKAYEALKDGNRK
jgi:tetratricopeptide (TPR) repeat protein